MFQLKELVSILEAAPINITESDLETELLGFCTDTRSLKPQEAFIALRGENFDGHDFVSQAIATGATIAITESQVTSHDQFPQLLVSDTLVAYQTIAQVWRKKFSIPVIGITGSFGKTTTKELISAVLSQNGTVLKTIANFNNEIGVPKTLLNINSSHDYAVIEMAMRGLGQIELLTKIANPTIAVITTVGTAHIGLLGSIEAIAQAKCELVANLDLDGIAILNYDNTLLMETSKKVWKGKTITFGLTGGDLHGELLDPYTIKLDGLTYPLPLPGKHNASNFLAALAVSKSLGLDYTGLTQGLEVEIPGGRAKKYDLANDITLLDETYNAGLESMIAALELLATTKGKRHFAVLGTMKELGEHSRSIHYQVGQKAKQLGLDGVIVVIDEPETEEILTGAAGIPLMEGFFGTSSDICDNVVTRLKEIIQPGDRILFKASRAVGLDRIVNLLK